MIILVALILTAVASPIGVILLVIGAIAAVKVMFFSKQITDEMISAAIGLMRENANRPSFRQDDAAVKRALMQRFSLSEGDYTELLKRVHSRISR